MKKILLTICFLSIGLSFVFSQEVIDDIYLTPKKAKAKQLKYYKKKRKLTQKRYVPTNLKKDAEKIVYVNENGKVQKEFSENDYLIVNDSIIYNSEDVAVAPDEQEENYEYAQRINTFHNDGYKTYSVYDNPTCYASSWNLRYDMWVSSWSFWNNPWRSWYSPYYYGWYDPFFYWDYPFYDYGLYGYYGYDYYGWGYPYGIYGGLYSYENVSNQSSRQDYRTGRFDGTKLRSNNSRRTSVWSGNGRSNSTDLGRTNAHNRTSSVRNSRGVNSYARSSRSSVRNGRGSSIRLKTRTGAVRNSREWNATRSVRNKNYSNRSTSRSSFRNHTSLRGSYERNSNVNRNSNRSRYSTTRSSSSRSYNRSSTRSSSNNSYRRSSSGSSGRSSSYRSSGRSSYSGSSSRSSSSRSSYSGRSSSSRSSSSSSRSSRGTRR